MIKPLTEKQQRAIANNVVKACKDINLLNKAGYDFINLAVGFIAHYNTQGLKTYYHPGSLKRKILSNQNCNQWDNFRPGDQNYAYYMSRKVTYNMIVGLLTKA